MTRLASLNVAILALSLVATSPAKAAPTPKQLLLDASARAAFAANHVKAMVLVHYHPPLAPGQDPKYRTPLQVRGVVVQDKGQIRVLAPTAHVLGATWVELELFDGKRVAATAVPPEGDAKEIPLMRLSPKAPLSGVKPVTWVAKDAPIKERQLWGVEFSATLMPGGTRVPVVINAVAGKPVEFPLERFFYAGIGGIVDGMALMTQEGRVACVVFRRVPGTRNMSLCTPRQAALKVPPRKGAKAEKLKLNTFGRKTLDDDAK